MLGGTPATLDARVREIIRLDPLTLRAVGATTVVVMLGVVWLDDGLWSTRARPGVGDPFLLWFAAQQALMAWLWSRAIASDIIVMRRFASLADRLQEVDLLDTRSLAPFARRGVRSVLYWMAGLAVFSLFWLAPNAGNLNTLPFVLMVGVAAMNLALPLLAARRRIRAEKDTQLARLRDAIRSEQADLLGSAASADAAARLPALLATEARIAAVGEWPLDAPTAARFALYVTLGVGSWLGGALVDRLLAVALDR